MTLYTCIMSTATARQCLLCTSNAISFNRFVLAESIHLNSVWNHRVSVRNLDNIVWITKIFTIGLGLSLYRNASKKFTFKIITHSALCFANNKNPARHLSSHTPSAENCPYKRIRWHLKAYQSQNLFCVENLRISKFHAICEIRCVFSSMQTGRPKAKEKMSVLCRVANLRIRVRGV